VAIIETGQTVSFIEKEDNTMGKDVQDNVAIIIILTDKTSAF
jgi:hypothetical protein